MTVKAAEKIGVNETLKFRTSSRLLVDPVILLCALALLGLGLVMMTSASISVADKNYGDPFYFFYRQLIFIGIGLMVGFAVWNMPLQVWDMLRPILLVAGLLLLIAVLIPGVGNNVNGATRWIRIASINFQISEVIKIFMVIFLAGYLTKHQDEIGKSIKPIFIPMVLLLIVSGLLLMEPDFGATVVIVATVMGMLWLAGSRLKIFIGLASVAVGLLALLAYSTPYRLERMTSFLDPWKDMFGSGFQLSQSLIAFGRGEWFGVGLGESVQKLFYLPEAHTDFVFAVIAEELGFIGALIVIALYTVIAWRALSIGRKAQQCCQYFLSYIAYGIGCWLIFQAYVNIGVNMGVLPTKGLTLPLMSYGGSSMVMSCFAIALLLRAEYELRFDYKNNKQEREAT